MLNNIYYALSLWVIRIKFKTRMPDQDTSLRTKAPQHLKQNMDTA